MKRKALEIFITSFLSITGSTQEINWNHFNNAAYRKIININSGIDQGFTYGFAYGYKVKSRLPMLLNIEFAAPFGETLFDDFKTKAGIKINWYRTGHFFFGSKLQGVFRREETPLVRLLNFGADISATAGYYKSGWYTSAEIGFDKAIVTNFKHSAFAKEEFPGIKDGWYEPATGGNFYYGIIGGISIHKIDIYLRLGKLVTQDFKTNPAVPFYTQLGINLKLKSN